MLLNGEEVRGRGALHKSQPEVVSDPLGDREWESWSKWDWRLRRKNRINPKVGRRGILGTGVSGVGKNERNPVWPGAISIRGGQH